MQRTIMAVGAHADDVEIYFGGTLLKYHDKGYRIAYVQSTNNMSGALRTVQPDGSLASRPLPPRETMRVRKAECAAAAAVFGTEPIHLDHPQRHCAAGDAKDAAKLELRYGTEVPDGVAANVPSILTACDDPASVRRVADLIIDQDPEVIFTHGTAEKNIEHVATALLVVAAYWRAVEAGYRGSLLQAVNRFEHLGPMACTWQTWVEVEPWLERRMAVLQKHESQYPPAFERAVMYWRDIARARGRACGGGAAEVFNFVNRATSGPDDGELLAELLRNRAAPGTVWGADVRYVLT